MAVLLDKHRWDNVKPVLVRDEGYTRVIDIDDALWIPSGKICTLNNEGIENAINLNDLQDFITAITAAAIPYDNSSSGLTSTNVQDAIDEIAHGGGGGGTSVDIKYNIAEDIHSGKAVAIDNSGLAVNASAVVSDSKYRVLGISIDSAIFSLGQQITVRKIGELRNLGWSFSGANKDLFLSTVPGEIMEVHPTAPGTVRERLGFSTSVNSMDIIRGEHVENS